MGFMIRIAAFLASILTSVIHSRTEFLTRQITDSFSRFEFTFQTGFHRIQASIAYMKKSFITSLIFWGSMAVAAMLVIGISLRNPADAHYENQVQGYYIQSYDMDLKTMFGQAPLYLVVSDGGNNSQLFGLDANASIQSLNGQSVSPQDLIPGMPLIVSWNGSAESPDSIFIQIPY